MAMRHYLTPETSATEWDATTGEFKFTVPKHKKALIQQYVDTYVAGPWKEDASQFGELFLQNLVSGADIVALELILRKNHEIKYAYSKAYFQFFECLVKETASVGFPSIGSALSNIDHDISPVLNLPVSDVRMLLGLRIYIADILVQILDDRKQMLSQMVHHVERAKQKKVTEFVAALTSVSYVLPSVFGSMPVIYEGKVADFKLPPIVDFSRVPPIYMRKLSPHIYIPDMEAAQALLAIGEKIFGRVPKTNQFETLKLLAKMDKKQLMLLFPDLDLTKTTSEEHRRRIEVVFGLPYEDSKRLFASMSF